VPGIALGGLDAKLGIFPSPMSAEVIDATGNALYSHSYIFNFGVPFKNTGLLTNTHLTSVIDLYLGIDTGVNAFLGEKGDNNDALAAQGGFGLNLLGGDLTMLALTHIGPENAEGAVDLAGFPIRVNSALRYLNDITTTWKINESLTAITDINFIHDDGLHASGGGVAQYLTYTLSDQWSVTGRAEVWRDDKGVFVAKFPANFDAVNAARGFPNTAVGGGKTTYGELTLGANYKPPVPKLFEGLVIRPELRFDDALNGTKPFNNGRSSHQVTIASDLILPF
jgi:putative OmpL-like beta-barrel porin-2